MPPPRRDPAPLSQESDPLAARAANTGNAIAAQLVIAHEIAALRQAITRLTDEVRVLSDEAFARQRQRIYGLD